MTKKAQDPAMAEAPMIGQEPIFDGGPPQAAVDEWKAKFLRVCATAFEDGSVYIWRVMNRLEWKGTMKDLAGADQHFLEEAILLKILLYPQIGHGEIQSLPGAVPTTIVEHFFRACGLGNAQLLEL